MRGMQGRPTLLNAWSVSSSGKVHGKVVCASGPWWASGDWWRADVWARDELDVAVIDGNLQGSKALYRIYRDLTNDEWLWEEFMTEVKRLN
jgi:hypothetical protein